MKTKKKLPFAYILAAATIVAMLSLTVWQFTLPEKNPLMIMVTLLGGGMIAGFIVANYRMNHSSVPFSTAVPLGIILLWMAFVFLGGGVWCAILENSIQAGIVSSVAAIFLGALGYKLLK